MDNLISTVNYVVSRSAELKNKFTDQSKVSVEFACIFCQNEKEYTEFTKEVENMGQVVEDTPTGFTYLLSDSIETTAGPLRLVKIRKPDFRKERGDADFNTNYEKFKKKYIDNSKFELIKRETFEMLRLSDSNFDVMACFSNIPKSENLDIKL